MLEFVRLAIETVDGAAKQAVGLLKSICVDFEMNGAPEETNDQVWITYALARALSALLKVISHDEKFEEWLPSGLLVDVLKKLIWRSSHGDDSVYEW